MSNQLSDFPVNLNLKLSLPSERRLPTLTQAE
jgi:hypothetical protein